MSAQRIYCIDTSSLIYCQHAFGNQPSRVTFFAAIWAFLDELADGGRLRAPHEVFVEITRSKDHVADWAQRHRGAFAPKGENVAKVIEILKVPGQRLASPSAPRGAEEADPWVIALAASINDQDPHLFGREEGIVVTEETKVGGIRDVSATLGIGCVDLVEMLTAEGITIGH